MLRSAMRLLTFASVVGLAGIAPAVAQAPDETVLVSGTSPLVTRKVEVRIGDLNLADGRDYARLQGRVVKAADIVCADSGLWNRFADFEARRCSRQAIATAMAQLPTSTVAAN